MTTPKTLFTTTAAVALLSGSAAFADVTAEDVWQNFQDFGARYGQRVTGDESKSGDTLTVSNVEMTMVVPDAEMNASLGQITFTEQGDGTVLITPSSTATYAVEADPDEGEEVKMTFTLTSDGMTIVAGGDPEAMTYDFVAAKLAMEITDIEVEDEEVEMTGTITMTDALGSYALSGDAIATGTSNMTIGSTDYRINVTDPEEGATVDMIGTMANLFSEASFAIPKIDDPADFSEVLQAGLQVDATYGYDGYNLVMNIDDGGAPGRVAVSAGKGALDLVLNKDTVDYGGAAENVQMSLSGMEIPFPKVDISFDKTGGRFMMPFSDEEAGDFALKLELVGMSISEQIWGMFDPAAVLPRDPATLVLDTSGKLRMLFDIFDPEAAALVGATGGQPAEVESISINQLVLSAIGAHLTGEGSFTFDNSDTTTFPGVPKPTGSAALNLKGANAVMDNLVKLGFVPEEQLMGVRMMLGMFARPGPGEDELTSTLEINEAGQILANGQRLR